MIPPRLPASLSLPGRPAPAGAPEPDPELCVYRGRTRRLLRKYLARSVEAGRLPSVIGREFFRAKVSWSSQQTFEDVVIFVHDVESCLERIEPFLQQLLAVIVLEDYNEEECARLLRCGRRTVERRLPEALDRAAEQFLAAGLLAPFGCQEAKIPPSRVSCCDLDE